MSLFSSNHSTLLFYFFFFNDTATTEIYTLSLHDALPICCPYPSRDLAKSCCACGPLDRKSTRLNSSHTVISYAVFCLKKKKKKINNIGENKKKKKEQQAKLKVQNK